MSGANFFGTYMIMIGVNGTGKTHNIIQLIDRYERALIIPSSAISIPQSWPKVERIYPALKDDVNPKDGKKKKVWYVPHLNHFKGKRVLDISRLQTQRDVREVLDSITGDIGGFKGGALVIDDLKNSVPSSGDIPFLFRQLMISRRMRHVSLFFAVHSISNVNPGLLDYGPQFMLFKTDRKPSDEVMKKMNNPEALELCRQHVNKVNTERISRGEKPWYWQPFNPGIVEC